MTRSWLLVAAAAICVQCVLGSVPCSPVPSQSLSSFTATTASAGTGPPAIGVNAGHNFDPSWVAWLQRLGVSGLRIFGLAGGFGTLEGFATSGLSAQDYKATWGNDLNNNAVTTQATFNTAVSLLRTPLGHTPGAYAWPNPPRWASHEILLNSTTIAPDGNSMLNTVASAQSIGVEPLLVFWMGCGVFSFSTLDPSNSTYWAERWELYKHQYIGARWAFNHGVRKLEFWNEPDLNSDCITAYSWLEHYTLQSQAIQNAYADLNIDVAANRIYCPVASCPFQPIILASAFAQDTYVQGPSSASSSYKPLANGLWSSYYTDDSYVYMGEETVLNEHTAFPPWSASARSGMVLASAQLNQPSVQNMNAFSFHSYGKYGSALAIAGLNDATYIAGNRSSTAMSIGSAQPIMPVATTEHAAHTTAAWNALSSTQDNNYESSRLASQILFMAKNGFETYIFKFSTLEQSNAITAGCTKFLWPPGTPSNILPAGSKISGSSTCGSGSTLCTPCGTQKTGIFWGENLNYPYPIGDSSLSAEAARLIINAMVGGGGSKRLETITGGFTNNPWCNATASVPGYMNLPIAVVNDGMRRTLLWVNEGYNPQDAIPGSSTVTLSFGSYSYYPALQSVPMNVTFNIAAWSVASGATIVHNLVAAGYNGEVGGAIIAGQSTGTVLGSTSVGGFYSTVTVLVPAYSTSAIVAPVGAQTETLMAATDRTTLYPGRSVASSMTVSTSITSDHTNTAIALAQFTLTGGSVLTAILELVVSSAPTSDMLMTVIGTTGSWSSNSATWQSVTQITNGSAPTSLITSPAQNFIRLDNGNAVAGHVTVLAGTSIGTTRRVDVTEYVRSVGAGSATFVIARRMRNGPFFGNSGGPIAADTLSGGATVSFSSASLRVMFGSPAPPPPPNMWAVTPHPPMPPAAVGSSSPPPPTAIGASPPPAAIATSPPPPTAIATSPPPPTAIVASPPPATTFPPPPAYPPGTVLYQKQYTREQAPGTVLSPPGNYSFPVDWHQVAANDAAANVVCTFAGPSALASHASFTAPCTVVPVYADSSKLQWGGGAFGRVSETLYAATGGYSEGESACSYMEGQFIEMFANASVNGLNQSRWNTQGSVSSSQIFNATGNVWNNSIWTTNGKVQNTWGVGVVADGYQDHCPLRPGSSGGTCTYVDPNNLQYGPNGVTMSIGQQGCINADGTNNPACCNSILNTAINSPYYNNKSTPVNFTVCASWSGAHLASNGCYQYGVFETEVMVNSMPAEGGARFYGGLYQMGCGDAGGMTSRVGGFYPNCDPSWNELDEAIYNVSGIGATYSTTSFVSVNPVTYTLNLEGEAGFASVHDWTGNGSTMCAFASSSLPSGTTQDCSWNTTSSKTWCPASPLCNWYRDPAAAQMGPGQQGGSGDGLGPNRPTSGKPSVPPYYGWQMNSFVNYKIVWTPTWVAWYLDGTLMRNESSYYRSVNASMPGGLPGGIVPWRPLTTRPLLRTGIGSAPIITGILQSQCGTLTAGTVVGAPAGQIWDYDYAGIMWANHSIRSNGSAILNLTANGQALDGSWAAGNCNPCATFGTSPPPITAYNCVVGNSTNPAKVTYLPGSSLTIRRVSYIPYSAQAIADAMVMPNSWSNPVMGPVTSPPPPPVGVASSPPPPAIAASPPPPPPTSASSSPPPPTAIAASPPPTSASSSPTPPPPFPSPPPPSNKVSNLAVINQTAVAMATARSPNYFAMSNAELNLATGGAGLGCQYIFQENFEEGFQNLNATRWNLPLSVGFDSVGNTATRQTMQMLVPGYPLTDYPTPSASGLLMNFSRAPCVANLSACAVTSVANGAVQQAYWMGPHLETSGCFMYGVFELEASIISPPYGASMFFAVLYTSGCSNTATCADASWNEIDQAIVWGTTGENGAGSLTTFQYHATAIISAIVNGQTIGAQATELSSFDNTTLPAFTTDFALQYHTYKLVWTPGWLAHMIDNVVYRNITYPLWRPSTYRMIVRSYYTASASNVPGPDTNIRIRRLKYTQLDSAGTVAAAASTQVNSWSALASPPPVSIQSSPPPISIQSSPPPPPPPSPKLPPPPPIVAASPPPPPIAAASPPPPPIVAASPPPPPIVAASPPLPSPEPPSPSPPPPPIADTSPPPPSSSSFTAVNGTTTIMTVIGSYPSWQWAFNGTIAQTLIVNAPGTYYFDDTLTGHDFAISSTLAPTITDVGFSTIGNLYGITVTNATPLYFYCIIPAHVNIMHGNVTVTGGAIQSPTPPPVVLQSPPPPVKSPPPPVIVISQSPPPPVKGPPPPVVIQSPPPPVVSQSPPPPVIAQSPPPLSIPGVPPAPRTPTGISTSLGLIGVIPADFNSVAFTNALSQALNVAAGRVSVTSALPYTAQFVAPTQRKILADVASTNVTFAVSGGNDLLNVLMTLGLITSDTTFFQELSTSFPTLLGIDQNEDVSPIFSDVSPPPPPGIVQSPPPPTKLSPPPPPTELSPPPPPTKRHPPQPIVNLPTGVSASFGLIGVSTADFTPMAFTNTMSQKTNVSADRITITSVTPYVAQYYAPAHRKILSDVASTNVTFVVVVVGDLDVILTTLTLITNDTSFVQALTVSFPMMIGVTQTAQVSTIYSTVCTAMCILGKVTCPSLGCCGCDAVPPPPGIGEISSEHVKQTTSGPSATVIVAIAVPAVALTLVTTAAAILVYRRQYFGIVGAREVRRFGYRRLQLRDA